MTTDDIRQFMVSTHALTRSATRVAFANTGLEHQFQPTRSRGARPLDAIASRVSACFNPRAHAERDEAALVR